MAKAGILAKIEEQADSRLPHQRRDDPVAARRRSAPRSGSAAWRQRHRQGQPILPRVLRRNRERSRRTAKPVNTPPRSGLRTGANASGCSATPNCPSCTARRRWSSALTSRASTSSACATCLRPRPTTRSDPAEPDGRGSPRSCSPTARPATPTTTTTSRRSQDMVAGAVAPPRLELGNQDLVRAHAHAIWLVEATWTSRRA